MPPHTGRRDEFSFQVPTAKSSTDFIQVILLAPKAQTNQRVGPSMTGAAVAAAFDSNRQRFRYL